MSQGGRLMHELAARAGVCCLPELIKTDPLHKPRPTRRNIPVDDARMIKLSFTPLAEISDAPKTWLPNDIAEPD